MPAVLPGHDREYLVTPARIGRIHRYLGQRRQFAGVVMPRRHRVVVHREVRTQVVDPFADPLGVPFRGGDLRVARRVAHRVVDRRRLLDVFLGYRSGPGHQRVASCRPLGRPAQAGQLPLLERADVEHALDLHQAGFRPGRARERLAGGAVTRSGVERRAPVRRRTGRRVPQQGEARAAPPFRRVHHEVQVCLVQVLPGGHLKPVPARGRTLRCGEPHFPWAAVPADGQPAAEGPVREPGPPGFVDAMGGQVDLVAPAYSARVGQVNALDVHPHSQPRPRRRRHPLLRCVERTHRHRESVRLVWWFAMSCELLLLSGRGGGR